MGEIEITWKAKASSMPEVTANHVKMYLRKGVSKSIVCLSSKIVCLHVRLSEDAFDKALRVDAVSVDFLGW